MESKHERSSPLPQAQSSSNEGETLFFEPRHTLRHGVESRDAVLEQCRECSDVIMLDSDDDLGNDLRTTTREITPPTHASTTSLTGAQIIERRTIPNPSTSREVASPDMRSKSGSKRKLFESKDAQENMYRLSGLPSPPRTEGSSPQSGFGLSESDLGRSGWSFESLATHQSAYRSQDQGSDLCNADELSLGLAQLVNQEATSDSTQRDCSVRPAPACDVALNAKDAVEAKGISRSQQLRAERKARKTNKQPHSSASPTSQASSSNPRPVVDTPYKIQKNRENQWEDVDELSADEIERQLDFAEMLRKESGTPKLRSTSSAPTHDKTPRPRLNPLSRTAAESFRTQSRHLNNDDDGLLYAKTFSASNDRPDSVDPEEQRRADERLMRIKMNALGGKPNSAPRVQANQANQASASPAKFHAPFDLKPTSKHKGSTQRPPKQSREAIRALMGTSQDPRTNDLSPRDAQWLESGGDLTNSPQTKLPDPKFAVLEQLSGCRAGAADDGGNAPKPQDRYDTLLPQGEALNLPSNFAGLSPTRQALIKKRETLKERQKDFEVIIEVYKAFATLLAIEELRDIDMRQLEEVKKFAAAVLDTDRSGRGARARIRNIIDNVRRRLQRLPSDVDKELVDEKLKDIMLPRYIDKLGQEKPVTQAALTLVQAECNAYQHVAKNRARDSRRAKDEVNTKGKAPADGLSKSERSRQAYYGAIDKRIEQHRSQLARFREEKTPSAAAEESGELEIIDPRDDESVISEEDAVDSLMRPLVSTNKAPRISEEELPTEESTRPDGEKQQQEAAKRVTVALPSQVADMSLQQRMLAKAQQIEHTSIQGVQRHDPQMLQDMREKEAARAGQAKQLEVATATLDAEERDREAVGDEATEAESSHEFDDSDIDDEDEEEAAVEEDEDGQPVCKRYIVRASMTGVSPEHDDAEHVIGRFLSKKKATKKVLEVAPWVKKEYVRRNPDSDSGPCSISLEDNGFEFEQQMKLGRNHEAACRTWIDEETYNPSEEAYEKAKVYKACQPQEAWFVDWERTIGPVQEDEEDAMEDAGQAKEQDLSATSAEPAATSPTDEHRECVIVNASGGSDSSTRARKTSPSSQDGHEGHQDSTNPTTELVTDSQSQPSAGNDDLFGPDSEPYTLPSSPPTSISETTKQTPQQVLTTRATGDHFRIFPSLAPANRHAKEVFMRWFIDRLPGRANFHYIAGEDESMEEELKRIGDRACWSRQEDFVERGVDGVKRNDRFRVWVRRARCRGPSN